jgi:hypothetical protein
MHRLRLAQRRRLPMLMVLTALYTATILSTGGCLHAAPNTTPQAAVAHYGTDIVQGINAVRAAVTTATESTPPVLTVERATPVMDKLRQAQEQAAQLSIQLKAYDAATTPVDRQNIGQKIQALLNSITAAVAAAGAGDMPQALLAQTSQLVTNVMATVNTIRSAAHLTQ